MRRRQGKRTKRVRHYSSAGGVTKLDNDMLMMAKGKGKVHDYHRVQAGGREDDGSSH